MINFTPPRTGAYGPDILLFFADHVLENIIWEEPAFTDQEWATILYQASFATRSLLFKNLPRIRTRLIKKNMEQTSPPSPEKVKELLSMIPERNDIEDYIVPADSMRDFDLSKVRIDTGQNHRFIWAEEPYSMIFTDVEESLLRWVMIINACRRFGIQILEKQLAPEIDEPTGTLITSALKSCRGNRFNPKTIRRTFLDNLEKTLDIMLLSCLGICSGSNFEGLRVNLAKRLDIKPSDFPETDYTLDTINEGTTPDETASCMLKLAANIRNEGIFYLGEILGSISSPYLSSGLKLVSEGLGPDFVENWLKNRKRLILQKAATNFSIAESSCLSILNRESPNLAQLTLHAHTLTEIPRTYRTGTVRQADSYPVSPKIKTENIPNSSPISLSSAFEWFKFKVCLSLEAKKSEDFLSTEKQIAEFAAIIPPERWSALEKKLDIPADMREQSFICGLDAALCQWNMPVADSLLNLVKNLKPDLLALPDRFVKFKQLFEKFRDLQYWDIMTLSPETLNLILDSLSESEKASLQYTAWGIYASSLGVDLRSESDSPTSPIVGRRAIMSALANHILDIHVSTETDTDSDDLSPISCPIIHPFIDSCTDIYFGKSRFEARESEDSTPAPPNGTLLPGIMLKELIFSRSEERVLILNKLPAHITIQIFNSIRKGTSEFKIIYNLLPHLGRTKRNKLLVQLEQTDIPIKSHLKKALDFGFDDFHLLSDAQLSELLRNITSQELCGALVESSPEFKKRIISNLSKRAAAMVEEDIKRYSCNMTADMLLKARQILVERVSELGLRPKGNITEIDVQQ